MCSRAPRHAHAARASRRRYGMQGIARTEIGAVTTRLTVTVPPGINGGDLVRVAAPDGSYHSIMVPGGLTPGQQFSVELLATSSHHSAEIQKLRVRRCARAASCPPPLRPHAARARSRTRAPHARSRSSDRSSSSTRSAPCDGRRSRRRFAHARYAQPLAHPLKPPKPLSAASPHDRPAPTVCAPLRCRRWRRCK